MAALARGVLLWLPLERLVRQRLEADLNSLWSDELFRLRLREVNRLEPGILGLFPADSFLEQYITLSTYQGELSTFGPKHLSPNMLARRAAYIQSADWYQYFTSIDMFHIGQIEALKSGVPAIQARLLAKYSVGRYWFPTIYDPRGIAWTNGLAAALYPLIERKTDSSMFETAGYLSKGQRGTYGVVEFRTGAAKYLALKNPDPLGKSPGGAVASKQENGDYSREKDKIRAVFRQLDVRALQIYLRQNPTALLEFSDPPYVPSNISEYLCRKAYALYLLAQSEPRLRLGEPYLTFVKTLAGLPVDLLARRGMSDDLYSTLIYLAERVFHPDLPPRLEIWVDDFSLAESEVYYDLPGFLRKYPDLDLGRSNRELAVRFLYARGLLPEVWSDPRIAQYLRDWTPSGLSEVDPKVEAEYQRILTILLADQTPL